MAEFRTTKGNRLDERAATVNRLLISDAEEAELATTRIADDSSSLAEWLKYYIDITSMHNGQRVKFKAFMTKFQEQISTKYSDEILGGNMEPVKKLDSVIRSVNLSWDIVAASEEEARNNLRRVSQLVQMSHPTRQTKKDMHYGYSGDDFVAPYSLSHHLAVPGGTPIFKVRFLNLIGNPTLPWGPSAKSGMLGYITGLSYNFEIDSGFFKNHDRDAHEVYPKLIKLSCTFWPQNTAPLSFLDLKKSITNKSPYGLAPHWSSDEIPEMPPPDVPPEINEAGERELFQNPTSGRTPAATAVHNMIAHGHASKLVEVEGGKSMSRVLNRQTMEYENAGMIEQGSKKYWESEEGSQARITNNSPSNVSTDKEPELPPHKKRDKRVKPFRVSLWPYLRIEE